PGGVCGAANLQATTTQIQTMAWIYDASEKAGGNLKAFAKAMMHQRNASAGTPSPLRDGWGMLDVPLKGDDLTFAFHVKDALAAQLKVAAADFKTDTANVC